MDKYRHHFASLGTKSIFYNWLGVVDAASNLFLLIDHRSAEFLWDIALALTFVAHKDVGKRDFFGLLGVSLVRIACRTIKLDTDGDVFGPLAVEVTDYLTRLIWVQAFVVAALGETILLEVTDEASLELFVWLGVLEKCVEDRLKDRRGHIAVLETEPIRLYLDPVCDRADGHFCDIEAGEAKPVCESKLAFTDVLEQYAAH